MAKKTPRGGDDYATGYCKPPRHTQFSPGVSGHPEGRTKGARGLKTDLKQELAARQTIHINGQPVTGSRQQLMIKTLTTRAAMGDIKASAQLIPLITQVLGSEDRGTGPEKLSAADQALLEFLLERGNDAPPRHDAIASHGAENDVGETSLSGADYADGDGEPDDD